DLHSPCPNIVERYCLHRLQHFFYFLRIVDGNAVVNIGYLIVEQAFVLYRIDLELSVDGRALDRFLGESNAELTSRKRILIPRIWKIVFCRRRRWALRMGGNKSSRNQ